MPHLVAHGDHPGRGPFWQCLLQVTRCRRALPARGRVAGLINLPAQGTRGNTHMLMRDRNSDQAAGLVQDWMARQGLMR
jgi:hypothetical protein